MIHRYETVFILTPVLSEAQMKEAVTKFRDFITSKGGKIKTENDWGLRKLAYPIQKKTTGFYHMFDFEIDPEAIADFEIQLRRDEKVIRFLTVKMDKYHTEYADKKIKQKQNENQEA
jgi:small subunit ribosomal protein S6